MKAQVSTRLQHEQIGAPLHGYSLGNEVFALLSPSQDGWASEVPNRRPETPVRKRLTNNQAGRRIQEHSSSCFAYSFSTLSFPDSVATSGAGINTSGTAVGRSNANSRMMASRRPRSGIDAVVSLEKFRFRRPNVSCHLRYFPSRKRCRCEA